MAKATAPAVEVSAVAAIMTEAYAAAAEASAEMLRKMGGEDRYACGFAWCDIYGVKLSTKLGKEMEKHGVRKSYTGGLQVWNPGKWGGQNVDVKEAGANAFAKVLSKYGFTAYSGSRLD